jgi:hypothetical protein
MAIVLDNSSSVVLADQAHRTYAGRDLRVDFFRGLALYMIFIDHVIGDPLSHFTYQVIGFSDAAEIFVFLSGLGCGIAYSRTLARKGWAGMMQAALRRSLRIYLFYLLSGGSVIALAAMSPGLWSKPEFAYTLGFAAKEPWPAIWNLVTMQSSPADSGILVLYIALTLFAVPLFLAASRHAPLGALAVSGCIWLMSRPLHDSSAFLIGGWYLNPFAWQFLFSIGMYFGVTWDRPDYSCAAQSWPRWLLPAAWAVVIGMFVYKLALFFLPHLLIDSSWLRISRLTIADMKRHFSWLRLIHFLSVAYVATAYVRPASPVMRWPVAKPLILSGQHSLEIFSMTVVLDMIDNVAVVALHPPIMERVLFDCLAFSAITLAAFAMARTAAPVKQV